MRKISTLLLAALLTVVGFNPTQAVTKQVSFTASIWADNWFALYVNGKKVAQDPVPITVTKSFNKVTTTFTASYPLQIALVAKDYVEDKSGLEYIGSQQQQIGDAGLVAQIVETKSQRFVAGTSSKWKSFVLFKAPLNPDCVKSTQPQVDCRSSSSGTPSGWYKSTFSDSKWPYAKEYTQQEVGVKDGYLEVKWNANSRLIWSSSLTQDNTVLFRYRVKSAPSTNKSSGFTITVPELGTATQLAVDNTCDGKSLMPALKWSGAPSGTKSYLVYMDTPIGPARPGEPATTDATHLLQYNIPASVFTLDKSLSSGTKGLTFKKTTGYVAPCSQGPGLKVYTFRILALSGIIQSESISLLQALEAASKITLASADLALSYSR